MTVSRVLNHPDIVAPETRQRVLAAIEELNYTPNRNARNLRFQRTQVIGLVSGDLHNSWIQRVYAGASAQATELGYRIVLGQAGGSKGVDGIESLIDQGVDGLVICQDANMDTKQVMRVTRRRIPVVVHSRQWLPGDIVNFDIDDVDGAFMAGQHLAELGHYKIAVIGGVVNSEVTQRRLQGFNQALTVHGLEPDPEVQYLAADSGEEHDLYTHGVQSMRTILNSGRPVTALFAHTVSIALGALHVLAERHKRVPDDLSIVAYDDERAAFYTPVPLTTVRQPAFELGAAAVRQLIDIIEGEEVEARRIMLRPELVKRASTQRVRAAAAE